LVAVLIYLKSSGVLSYMSSLEDFKTYIEGFGDKAYIVFFILQLISIIIAPIPSNVSTVAGAMIFGMWKSFIITMIAIISGSIIVFLLARKFGKAFTERFVNPKISEKYEKIINSSKGELMITLMLLFPFFPDDIINFLVGLSGISFKRYFIILILTRPWEILILTRPWEILIASALGSSNIAIPIWEWAIIILVVIFIVINSSKIEERLTKVIKEI
jgi:uncharacterized membrane protein YdjX (TVP38/TMEM64 family)